MNSRGLESYPLLAAMRHAFKTEHRFSGDIVDRAYAAFGDRWATSFEEAMNRLFPLDDERAAAIKGYAAFAMTSLRLQGRFEISGQYKSKTYAEAAAEVYHNEAFMQMEYLPGLFISHYLWPHHYRQIEFFKTAFMASLDVSGVDHFIEVGVGTGLYSRIALQRLPQATGLGIDISASSKQFAERQMAAFGFSPRYTVKLEDATVDTPATSASALICVEVLEHLEDPVAFLRALRGILKPGGKAFITAALNAAHTDHIYLYRSPGEVEEQLIEAGFVVEQYYVGQAYAPPKSGAPVPLAAAFVVY